MPRVQFGNLYYMIYIIAAFLIILIALRFLKHKSQNYRYWFLFGLLVLNFGIHIFKIFLPIYQDNVTYLITKVSFENICAVSAITFPFLYFVKNRTVKDYMIMVGMASGIITFIFPVDAMSTWFNGRDLGVYRHAFNLENIRFYFSHFLIFLVPFLMMHYGMHELSIKRAYRAPLFLIFILFVIFINEFIITLLGWVPKSELFDPTKRNPSFIFGVRGDLSGLGMILGVFVPSVFFVNPWFSGHAFMPVLWLVFPAIFYGGLIALTFMLIYDTEETLYYLKLKIRIPQQEEPEELKR
ncbi:MAG: hypothetical protein NUK62_01815 [Tenericutes bacterium]|nr:hypothetical protein [Mycoplasmatota bacterium]